MTPLTCPFSEDGRHVWSAATLEQRHLEAMPDEADCDIYELEKRCVLCGMPYDPELNGDE